MSFTSTASRPSTRTFNRDPETDHRGVRIAWAAKGSNDPDWTVGVKMARLRNGGFIILDVVRFRGGPEEVRERIVQTAINDGHHVTISLPQDPGAAGSTWSTT